MSFPSGQDTALSHEGHEAGHIFRHARHDLIRKTLILEAFVHVVEKASPKPWMVRKQRAGIGWSAPQI